MLAPIHDPAEGCGGGFAAEPPCLTGSSSTGSSFAVGICDFEKLGIGEGMVQLGGGPGGLGMPTARTCALQMGKSARE